MGKWENGRVLGFRTAIEQGTFVDGDLQFLENASTAVLYRILSITCMGQRLTHVLTVHGSTGLGLCWPSNAKKWLSSAVVATL